MKNATLHIITLFVGVALATVQDLSAKTIYTWIDQHGVVHLTENPPPENGRLKSAIEYSPQSERLSSDTPTQQTTQIETGAIDAAVKKAEQLRQIAESAKREAAEAQAESAAADRRLYEVKTRIARNRQLLRRNKALVERLEAESISAKTQAIAATQKADQAEKNADQAEDQALKLMNQSDSL